METYAGDYLRCSEILCVKETGSCHRWMDRVSPHSEDCFTPPPICHGFYSPIQFNLALTVQSFLTCLKVEKTRLSLD